MAIDTLVKARAVIEACKFGRNTFQWHKLSEPERMTLRDAIIKAHAWGNDKLTNSWVKGAIKDMTISEMPQSNINWDAIDPPKE